MSWCPGKRLGPYEIVAPLGAGGMGEVYRARDTRLGREVAVKVLPAEFAQDPERLRRFEQEARATAALDHPNILAIHDIGTHEGTPYIVEQLLEGESLRQRLRGGPVTPAKAVEFGIQIAQGLAAAHEKGIVHRDLKPENLFVTKDGRIKILDFGLARLRVEGQRGPVQSEIATEDRPTAAGQVMGTPGYMAPEQVRGLAVDHRADIFALGAVLYEMLSGRRAFSGLTVADQLSAILSEDPPPVSRAAERVPPAFDGIVRRCLEKRPEDRFTSARDVAFALQALVGQVPAEVSVRREEARPYPGLASFTEQDSGNFFGREAEVSALWRKIPGRDLLALIGPSGAGKSSFLRAGVVPHAPPGWRVVHCTPGQAPFAALGQALAPAFAGDPDAYQRLLEFHVPVVALGLISQWRARTDHALVIVDQFEELFTLSGEDVQARFADLIGKISALDGVHVLLSMRDDFLMRTQEQAPMRPILFDLTGLLPLSGENLRQAVVKPAGALGFAFEDDGLVEEMMEAVAGERGALPLLAFTLARLWDERDRDRKLLTRSAYVALGGVSGALAKHADTVLDRLGEASLPVVREIFRNLTTSQQTRCVLDAEELVSVFPKENRDEARRVLRELVQARLLTTFEVEGPEGRRHHRVEIVHESLLQTWPRLLRWRTEDEGSAQLRDQLRQAAHLWEEKGRPDDLLWAGTSFQEYQVWRDRYPGGLSEVEEQFGVAMTARAGRRRRLRLTAYAALLVAVCATAVVIGISRRQAVIQRHQAEAAQLLALGRLRLADHPNAALAYAVASLEASDSGPARRFAVEALAQGPSALFLKDRVASCFPLWSPDGERLAIGGPSGLEVVDRETGEQKQFRAGLEWPVAFTSDGHRLVVHDMTGRSLQFWALPEGRLERTLGLHDKDWGFIQPPGEECVVGFEWENQVPALIHLLPLDGSEGRLLGRWMLGGRRDFDVDWKGNRLVYWQKGIVSEQRLDDLSAPPRLLGTHDADYAAVTVRPWHDRAVSSGGQGNVRIWDLAAGRLERTLKSPEVADQVALDPKQRFLAAGPTGAMPRGSLVLFDLAAPPCAAPVPLMGGEYPQMNFMGFSPDGSWLATTHDGVVILWNTAGRRPILLGRQEPPDVDVAFTQDGHLLSSSEGGTLRLWPISFSAGDATRVLWSKPGAWIGAFGAQNLAVDRRRRAVILAEIGARTIHVVPLDGSPASTFTLTKPQGVGQSFITRLALEPSGRRAAVYFFSLDHPEAHAVRVLDLTTGVERALDTHPKGDKGWGFGGVVAGFAAPAWLADDRLVTDGDAGLLLWDLDAGTCRLLRRAQRPPQEESGLALLATPDGHALVRLYASNRTGLASALTVFDMASNTTREITTHGNVLTSCALDEAGTALVTGDATGVVRVGRLTGEEPHLLFGHTGKVTSVAVSPDGKWIASGSDDGTIRLWPMPDLSKPPLHTLPHDELVGTLKALTNLRAVRDPASDTGWKIEIGPFPGWAKTPEWQP